MAAVGVMIELKHSADLKAPFPEAPEPGFAPETPAGAEAPPALDLGGVPRAAGVTYDTAFDAVALPGMAARAERGRSPRHWRPLRPHNTVASTAPSG